MKQIPLSQGGMGRLSMMKISSGSFVWTISRQPMNRTEIELLAQIDNLQNAIDHHQAEVYVLRIRLRETKQQLSRLRPAKSQQKLKGRKAQVTNSNPHLSKSDSYLAKIRGEFLMASWPSFSSSAALAHLSQLTGSATRTEAHRRQEAMIRAERTRLAHVICFALPDMAIAGCWRGGHKGSQMTWGNGKGQSARDWLMSSVSPYRMIAGCGDVGVGKNRRTEMKKTKGASFQRRPCAIVCPADADLAKLPFPSKQWWITVGALLTSNQGLS
jgi:hypothetical protein